MSNQGGLPSSGDFFGGAAQPGSPGGSLPTANDFFADAPAPEPISGGAALDSFLSQNPIGKVLDHFGQGAKQAWGTQPVGLSEDTEAFLRKAGIFNDYNSGRTSLLKSFNEAVVRPAVASADFAQRAFGAAVGGTEAALAQTGAEAQTTAPGRFIGAQKLGETLAGGVEFAGQTGVPELTGAIHGPFDLPKARSLGVIGEGEGGYFGTVEPAPETAADRAEAVKQQVAAEPEQAAPAPPPGQPVAATVPATETPDIHAIAREIAPGTFQQYDALTTRQNTYRTWLGELGEQRGETPAALEAQARIDGILGKVGGVEDRLTKAAADRLEAARNDFAEATTRDTPDMALVRENLLKTQHSLWDLAPDVRAAYEQAQKRLPTQEVTAAPEQAVTAAPAAQEATTPAPVPAQESPAAAPTQPQLPLGAPGAAAPLAAAEPVTGTPNVTGEKLGSGTIATDVSRKLQAAGRLAEESDAAAALVQAHYEARAARFGGAKGTAEDIYDREGPEIKAGKSRARTPEMAQPEGKELEQQKRGSIALKDARNTIKLFGNADASTFLHESGHQWLEELMHDAADEIAPEELKADAKTVRNYIGAKEGEAIPTRAHEKFARGFERYMMEGVAPNKALAGVFAKFKAWLTQIYQTVNKLRSPITPEIRAVFDRLIATPGREPIIAGERDVADMASEHQKLATETPPEKAAETADKVRADIDKTAKEKVPNVYRELNPNAGIAAENENPAGGGNEAGPVTGDNGSPAEPGTVPEGGNEAAAEGGKAPNVGATPEPTGANERFTNPESNLVDKAGNIRLDNLNTPEDVSQVIRETAEDTGGFMEARRGVISDGQVLDLADALGMDPKFLNSRKLGEAFNAEQVMAARKLLIKSATNVRDLMRKAADGTDDDVMAYAEAKARHVMIQEQVSGITAEAGRALRAFRKIEGSDEAKAVGDFLKDATGRTLNQLREEAKFGAKLETPAQVSKYMDDLTRHPLKNAILEYYINDLISGPITHLRYSVGNALNALWTPLVQIPIGAAIGTARETLHLGADANRIYMGEAGAQLFAMMKGSRDGWKAATEAFSTGISPSLPGERVHVQIPPAIPGVAGKIIRIPGKSVSAIHTFFKSLRYEQNIQGLAYRTAMNEGLSGDAFANRVSDLTVRPTPEMMDESGYLDPEKMEKQHFENAESATQNALKELYMAPTKYDSAMGALNRAIDRSLVAKIIVPFMKIGSQITRNAFIEQTPIGLFSKDIRDEFAKGGAAADFQAAKMTAGIALAGITVGLAAEGLAVGDGPEDPHQRAVWMLNHRPNTVTIGDISIPYQGLGSLGMLMRFSANTYDVAHQIGHEDAAKLGVAFLEGATKSVLDENFMRGVKDMLDAVYHPEEYGLNYLKDFATNWLPFSVGLGQISRLVDPDQREAEGVWQAAKQKIPYWSETLPARRDMFGEPIPNSGPLPSYATDPVVQAMEALKIAPGKLTRKIRGIPLTDEQYDQYSMLAGRMSKMQLNTVVSLPGFDQFPAATRIELIHNAISSSREVARANIMAQDPTIIQRAIQAKIDPLKDQQSDFDQAIPENATANQ